MSNLKFRFSLYLLFLCLVVVACSDGATVNSNVSDSKPVSAVPIVGNSETLVSAPLEKNEPILFSYNAVGRRDPFRSLVAETVGSQKSVGSLPPLQRNSVTDLRLQGIIWGSYGPRAVVNTPDGKGYTVHIGTKIGPNGGFIISITQKKVVVEETLKNIFGESTKREIFMELHPQEEG